MEKIQENVCKQACSIFSYKRTTSKHICLCFLHLVLIFTPPLQHSIKKSIESGQPVNDL